MILLSGDVASVDNKRCAGGEFGGIRREIENRRGDLFGRADTPDRNGGNDLLLHFAGKAIPHLRDNRPWSDSVDANVVLGEFNATDFGQAFDGKFGCDVDADLRHA